MRKRFWKGLRTIDLVIGLILICMVLALVLWRVDEFRCRSMQSEAKFALQEVYAAQQLFFAEHDRYATIKQLVEVDKRVVLPQRYYELIDLEQPSDLRFSVVARGVVGTLVEGEEWSIDHGNDLALKKRVCNK